MPRNWDCSDYSSVLPALFNTPTEVPDVDENGLPTTRTINESALYAQVEAYHAGRTCYSPYENNRFQYESDYTVYERALLEIAVDKSSNNRVVAESDI